MRMLSISSLIAAAMLSGCMASRPYRPAYAFRCGAVRDFGNGKLMVARWIGHDRRTAANVLRWMPRMPEKSFAYIEVEWAARPPAEVDLEHGVLMLSYRLAAFQLGKGAFIELRATPAADGGVSFKGRINPRRSRDTIKLTADWSQVRRLSGENPLYLLVHDGSGAVVGTETLPAELFWEAPARAETLASIQSGPEPDVLLGYGCERDSSPPRG